MAGFEALIETVCVGSMRVFLQMRQSLASQACACRFKIFRLLCSQDLLIPCESKYKNEEVHAQKCV